MDLPHDFSANINPFSPHPDIMEILGSSLKDERTLVDYPDPTYCRARRSLAAYEGIGNSDSILLTNGEIELIKLFCEIFAERGTDAVVTSPTFCEYERFIRLNEAYAHHVPITGKKGSEIVDSIIQTCTNRTSVCFVCNPNNPTGGIIGKKHLIRLADALDDTNTMLYVDEAFIEYEKKESAAKEVSSRENIFVGRSLTKILGIPGLRIGYAIGCVKAIELVSKVQTPWSVNSLARDVAENIGSLKGCIDEMVAHVNVERPRLADAIGSIEGLEPFSSHANFVMVRCKRHTAAQMAEMMRREGFLVRGCHTFIGGDKTCIRVAVRTREENDMLIEALGKVCNG